MKCREREEEKSAEIVPVNEEKENKDLISQLKMEKDFIKAD